MRIVLTAPEVVRLAREKVELAMFIQTVERVHECERTEERWRKLMLIQSVQRTH